MAIGKVKR